MPTSFSPLSLSQGWDGFFIIITYCPKSANTPIKFSTHLPIPEVAATGSLEDKDIVGVEGGASSSHLKGLGVVFISSMHLEKPSGGHGICVASSRCASLGKEKKKSEEH